MKTVSVRRYIALRQSLQKEKARLESRLAQITKALGNDETDAPATTDRRDVSKRRRRRNKVSLREAVRAATKAKPLGKAEILKEVQKQGYRFSVSNPINSLNTVLYSNKQFKNVNGKFSPA